MRIDAHQHYWAITRRDYGWLTPDKIPLYRDFLPGDLAPHLRSHAIEGTILVQAAPTLNETEFLLDLSEQTDSIVGVVGWLDLAVPAYQAHFERFSRHPKFVGLRLMIQDMKNPEDVLESHSIDALRYFADREVPIDLLVLANQLPVLTALLRQVPHLRAVVDHLGKPAIAQQDWQPWQTLMSEIASYPAVYCKLSGMVTQAQRDDGKTADCSAYIQHVIQAFGSFRVMFGSDWPVCLLAASYDDVCEVLLRALPVHWTDTEHAGVCGDNARQFYKLP